MSCARRAQDDHDPGDLGHGLELVENVLDERGLADLEQGLGRSHAIRHAGCEQDRAEAHARSFAAGCVSRSRLARTGTPSSIALPRRQATSSATIESAISSGCPGADLDAQGRAQAGERRGRDPLGFEPHHELVALGLRADEAAESRTRADERAHQRLVERMVVRHHDDRGVGIQRQFGDHGFGVVAVDRTRAREARRVRPRLAGVDHDGLEADGARQLDQGTRDVARAEHDQARRHRHALEEHGQNAAAAHAQVAREIELEQPGRGRAFEQRARLLEHPAARTLPRRRCRRSRRPA
jgi:hypothetical protein